MDTDHRADEAWVLGVQRKLYQWSKEMTTGTVSHATDPVGWFVMVKSAEPRFPDNPLWGDGWGWAYFDPEDRTTAATEDYDAECKTCHVPAEDTDWVYVRGYPVLNGR